jgi:hypothetical protein
MLTRVFVLVAMHGLKVDKHWTEMNLTFDREKLGSNVLHYACNLWFYSVIRRDLQIPTVKEEIRRYSSQYSARLSAHPNDVIVNLIELPDNRRLRRHLPNDLPTRFLVKLSCL